MTDEWTDKVTNLLAPPQGAGQIFFAVAHSIHVSNSHTKFDWISSNVGRMEAIAKILIAKSVGIIIAG